MAVKKLFDHINAITSEQDPKYFDKLTEEDLKSWSNFMINRFLSMRQHDQPQLISSKFPNLRYLFSGNHFFTFLIRIIFVLPILSSLFESDSCSTPINFLIILGKSFNLNI